MTNKKLITKGTIVDHLTNLIVNDELLSTYTVVVSGHHSQISRLVRHINDFTIYSAEIVQEMPHMAQIWTEYEDDETLEEQKAQIIEVIDSLNELIQGHGQLEVEGR